MLHATGHARMVKTRTEKSCPNFQFRVARARARLQTSLDGRRASTVLCSRSEGDAREAMTVGCKPTRIHLTRSVA